MRPARTLTLRKEALAELRADELDQLGGAAGTLECVSRILRLCVVSGDPGCIVSRVIWPCLTEDTCTR
jgi:hypothetical protein